MVALICALLDGLESSSSKKGTRCFSWGSIDLNSWSKPDITPKTKMAASLKAYQEFKVITVLPSGV